MSTYAEALHEMTDEELSREWVAVMTAQHDLDHREAQLEAIDSVNFEINERYETGGFSALIVSAKDAQKVTEHLKRLIGSGDVDWFGEKDPGEA